MKTIGIYTQDFSVFHDIVRLLKERDVEFHSLKAGMVPPWINVVITTEDSRGEINFEHVIIAEKHAVESAVEEAILTLGKTRDHHALVIGIDPGERPGIAVYGDRELLTTGKVEYPEDSAAMVKRLMDFYRCDDVVVRIGHGAPTFRNRIINVLLPLNVKIEIVNERSTTSKNRMPDIQAAILIGLKLGRKVSREMIVAPSKGEIEDIKRRSRILSKGRFTISNDRAVAVAKGESTLDNEVERTEMLLFGDIEEEDDDEEIEVEEES